MMIHYLAVTSGFVRCPENTYWNALRQHCVGIMVWSSSQCSGPVKGNANGIAHNEDNFLFQYDNVPVHKLRFIQTRFGEFGSGFGAGFPISSNRSLRIVSLSGKVTLAKCLNFSIQRRFRQSRVSNFVANVWQGPHTEATVNRPPFAYTV